MSDEPLTIPKLSYASPSLQPRFSNLAIASILLLGMHLVCMGLVMLAGINERPLIWFLIVCPPINYVVSIAAVWQTTGNSDLRGEALATVAWCISAVCCYIELVILFVFVTFW